MDYSTLRKQILNDVSTDASVKKAVSNLNKRLKKGDATFGDVSMIARKMSKVVSKGVTKAMPETDIGAYAESVVAPVYTQAQKTLITAGKRVQKGLNAKAGIQLEPAELNPDSSRVGHIVKRFKEAESADTVSFLLGEDVVENIFRSAVNDSIRENARQLDDAGFETYVTRTDDAGCCAWCSTMVGVYRIDDIPSDFWAVHKNCSCEFEYKSYDTHHKIRFGTDDKGDLRKITTKI